MSDPYAAFSDPVGNDPYASFSDPVSATQPSFQGLQPSDAVDALSSARAQLERQIANLPPQAQAIARQKFAADPRVQAIEQTAAHRPIGLMGELQGFGQEVANVGSNALSFLGRVNPLNMAIQTAQDATGVHIIPTMGDQAQAIRHDVQQAVDNSHYKSGKIGQFAGDVTTTLPMLAAPEAALPDAVTSVLPRAAARIIGRGAIQNAGMGALQASDPNSLSDVAQNAGIGALTGRAGEALGNGIGALATGVADPVKRALSEAGVNFTPGQAMGGVAQTLEQKLASIPIMGDAIRNRLAESGQQFNTATLNRALNKAGLDALPASSVGTDAFTKGQQAFDKAYSAARANMNFSRTPEFDQALSDLQDRVVNGGVDSLSEPFQTKFANVVKNTLERRIAPDGTMSGDTYKSVVSDLQKAARQYLGGANPADAREYGQALADLAGIVDTAAKQSSDPAAAAQMAKVDSGYRLWALAEKAADNSGPTNAGAFTPGQYLRAVEQSDNSARNRAFSAGRAFDQQYAQQALNALGKNLPNSFTADRTLAAGLLGEALSGNLVHGLAAMGTPGAAAIGTGIPAAALAGGALYSRPANAFANKLMFGGGAVRAKIGQKFNSLAPAIGRAAAAGGALAIQNAAK